MEMDNHTICGKDALGFMWIKGMKKTILLNITAADPEKNEEDYAELVQYLHSKSLSLIMTNDADDQCKVLQILCAHYHEKASLVY